MEYGTIEREVQINASPATVFEVITSPEHLKEWWPDEAVARADPGCEGRAGLRRPVVGGRAHPQAHRGRRRAVPAVLVPLDPPGGRGRQGGQLAARHLRADRQRRRDPPAHDRDPASARWAGRSPCSSSSTRTTSRAGTTSCPAWSTMPPRSRWRRDRRRRRRAVVGGGRPDPAPDARPPAGRRPRARRPR